MRIVGGIHRGTQLADVGAGDPAAHLRPTSDRVREALFNMLCQGRWGDLVQGRRVLDLFAGTGALGLEALSRGATQITLVDDGATARALIRTNIETLRAMGTTRLYRRNATDLGPNRGPGFGLVFLDPPYGQALGQAALASAQGGNWLARQATVVWEENAPQPAPAGFETLDQRRYGETWITLLRAP
ncbi:MAG: 16S rRNA (guanine(966)-N(2))-methyltransferase RsmD [Rhodobacteraceae bacterium]|jgi:16S rRNA (guanine966-N2)-methyltransferase|nr:16S rRNA (guanine(966)-N(2))-methyltransferase RsmD [Paracoccaceae bacterium]